MSDDFDVFTGMPFYSGSVRPRFSSALDLRGARAPGDERQRYSTSVKPLPHPEDRSPSPAPPTMPPPAQRREAHLDDQIARAVEKDELERTLAAAARALAEAKLREVAGDKIAGARALLQEHRQHCKNYSLRKNAPVRYCATCRAFEHTVELVEKENGT